MKLVPTRRRRRRAAPGCALVIGLALRRRRPRLAVDPECRRPPAGHALRWCCTPRRRRWPSTRPVDGWPTTTPAPCAGSTPRPAPPSVARARSGDGRSPWRRASGASGWPTSGGNRVWEIDPKTGAVVGLADPRGPRDRCRWPPGTAGSGWRASWRAPSASSTPAARQVLASGTLPDGAVRLAVGADGVWVSGQTDSLTRVEPTPVDGSLQWRTVDVGQGPFGVGDRRRVGVGGEREVRIGVARRPRLDAGDGHLHRGRRRAEGCPPTPRWWRCGTDRVWVADGQQGSRGRPRPRPPASRPACPSRSPGVIRQLVVDTGPRCGGPPPIPAPWCDFSS